MRICVAGYGFVGRAHALALESEHDIGIYDPPKGYKFPPRADACIIAVSTPPSADGFCDMNNVFSVIEKYQDVPILIKSTISLEGWRLINRAFPDAQITFSPEFLRAAHAFEDMKNQKVVYVGGGESLLWSSILSMSLGVTVRTAKPEELILAKYTRNSFLASKVAFFNEIYDLCEEVGADFDSVREVVCEDSRIGDSHSFVDPEDRGFGGHCFPKDTSAFVMSGRQHGKRLTILESVIKYNSMLKDNE